VKLRFALFTHGSALLPPQHWAEGCNPLRGWHGAINHLTVFAGGSAHLTEGCHFFIIAIAATISLWK
jgi:hypothetical protein